ncbi:hypothetical protein [Candidatus Uabimicrobium sp. HlEnr_7]|uniref:hypothetical protein n=1 Tax=Candidatus Uabimicrobium helgolandensis TaxID=3095367 RepID=UPI003556EAA4
MLPAKIHDLKNKVFTIIVATVLAVTIISFIFHFYFYDKSKRQYQNLNQHKIKRFFTEYFQQKKENLDYMASYAKKSYQDSAKQQRDTVRQKKRAVKQYYTHIKKEIEVFNDNPFFSKMIENLYRGYVQKKLDVWKKYNRYTNKVEAFARAKKIEHIYMVSMSGEVVWSTNKASSSLFRKNLASKNYKKLAIAKAFSAGKKNTFVSDIDAKQKTFFVASPTKEVVTIFQMKTTQTIEPILYEGISQQISDIFIVGQDKKLRTKSLHSQTQVFLSKVWSKNTVASSIYRDLSQRFVVGSFSQIENTPWTLYIESQLQNIFYNDLQSLMHFFHKNEQCNVHVFFSKTMQTLLTTNNLFQEKITDFLKIHLQKKSFAMVVDKQNQDLGSVYLANKVVLEQHFPLYIVIETSMNKIHKNVSINTKNMEFKLFIGRKNLLPAASTNAIPVRILQQDSIITLNKLSGSKELALYFIFAVIVLVTVAICYYNLAPQFYQLYQESQLNQHQWNDMATNLKKIEHNIIQRSQEAEDLRSTCHSANTQLQTFITANQDLEVMLGDVEKIFAKLIKTLQENIKNIDKVSDLVNQLTKYQHNISITINKAQGLSFTSSILSLNTSIEASNSSEHEAFSILAKEYQSVASSIQFFLQETTRQVVDSANNFHTLNQLTNRQQLAKEIIEIMRNRLQLLIRVKQWCQEQKIPLQNTQNFLKKMEENCTIQAIEQQTTASNLRNLLTFLSYRKTETTIPHLHNSLMQREDTEATLLQKNITTQDRNLVPLKEIEYSDF